MNDRTGEGNLSTNENNEKYNSVGAAQQPEHN